MNFTQNLLLSQRPAVITLDQDSILINHSHSHLLLEAQTLTVGGRGTDVIGWALAGGFDAEEGGGGWGISLGLLGPIFSLLSSSGTSPLALWIASICSWRVILAWAACCVRAMLPEWPSQVTWEDTINQNNSSLSRLQHELQINQESSFTARTKFKRLLSL